MTLKQYEKAMRRQIDNIHRTFCRHEKRDAHGSIIGKPTCDYCDTRDYASVIFSRAVLLGAKAGKAGIIPIK